MAEEATRALPSPVAVGAVPRASSITPRAVVTTGGADALTFRDLGIAYKEMGLHDAAVAEFAKLVDNQEHEVFALTMMGECYEARGAPAEALLHYKKALNRPSVSDEEATQLYYQLGRVFHTLGDESEALYFFEKVARRVPGFADVSQRVASLRSKGVAPMRSRGAGPGGRRTIRSGRPAPSLMTASHDLAPMIDRAAEYFRGLQDRIVEGLEQLDGKRFRSDEWDRPGGGGGRSRVLADGNVFEKAGVNFSDVHGQFRPEMAASLPGAGTAFRATGISLVLHPRNPHVPTVHANFRRLERGPAADGTGGTGWFGGGADLTPYYLYPEDATHFHGTLKRVCDAHDPGAVSPVQSLVRSILFHPPPGRTARRRGRVLRLPGCGRRGHRSASPARRRPPARWRAIPSDFSVSFAPWATPSCRLTCPSPSGAAS